MGRCVLHIDLSVGNFAFSVDCPSSCVTVDGVSEMTFPFKGFVRAVPLRLPLSFRSSMGDH